MALRGSIGVPGLNRQESLAADLGALLERLEIPARICDGQGELLFATADANEALASCSVTDMQALQVRLIGETLCVTTRANRTDCVGLTPRQLVVIQLMADGLENEQIAERLQISLHTVRRHVEALMQRLKVRSRRDAQQLLLQHRRATEARQMGPRRVA